MMSTERSVEVVRDSIEAAINRDWRRLADTLAEDAVLMLDEGPVRGRDAIAELWHGCHEEEADMQGEIINLVAEGDTVVAEWRHWGVMHKIFGGLPEEVLGRRLEATELWVCKLRDGRIASIKIYGGECRVEGLSMRRTWQATPAGA